MIRIELAGVTDVDRVWPKITFDMEHACLKTGGDMTSEYLWQQCRAGSAFLFIVHDDGEIIAASVWRFERWQTGKKLRCLALFGRDMGDWLSQHREAVNGLARIGGAQSIIAEGRKGWERMFPEAKVLRQLLEVAL